MRTFLAYNCSQVPPSGTIMAPLFLEGPEPGLAKSGRFLTWKNEAFIDVGKNPASVAPADWERLRNISLDLCGDEQIRRCAARLASIRAC